MFMNMNFEWIASFPGRDNYCGLFQFPGTLNLSELSIVTRHVGASISFQKLSPSFHWCDSAYYSSDDIIRKTA